jgi:lipid-A-disaccharide synthase-like uncharacterized protein
MCIFHNSLNDLYWTITIWGNWALLILSITGKNQVDEVNSYSSKFEKVINMFLSLSHEEKHAMITRNT